MECMGVSRVSGIQGGESQEERENSSVNHSRCREK